MTPLRNKLINTAVLICACMSAFPQESFIEGQMRSSRVKKAYQKLPQVKEALKKQKVNADNYNVMIRCFKEEGVLEAWCRSGDDNYKLVRSYSICAPSGGPGPKRQQGDLQVPEGFYEIASFHPYSSYHLAMKVSYPNKSDRIRATAPDPGGDIMIHGKCVTIGCIPLQDGPVEELYVLCAESRKHGKKIPVHIFPFRMTDERMKNVPRSSHLPFWQEIRPAFTYFESNHRLQKITVSSKGNYIFTAN